VFDRTHVRPHDSQQLQEAAMSTMTLSAGLGRPRGRRAHRPAPVPAARLTRRGRLLLSLVVLLAAVAGAVLMTGGPVALAGTDREPVTHRQVTVAPGQTLWQIAERAAPGSDPRETVQRILDLNGLRTAQVQAGTALLLP
jgi:Tfp pilus assembly protein FimV